MPDLSGRAPKTALFRLDGSDADQLLELSAAPDGIWHSRPFFTQEQLGATPALEHLGSLSVDQLGRIWLGCGARGECHSL
jgi:hypothetical protein